MHVKTNHFTFIGSASSFFSQQFIPGLLNLAPATLLFVCIRQNEFIVEPSNPDRWLKFINLIRKLKYVIREFSSRIYWIRYCHQHQIKFMYCNEVNHETVQSELKQSDFILTAGLRQHFHSQTIAATKNGIINFHYSLLPKYRGTNPVFWQKLAGDNSFGYTFHLVNEKTDTGPILLQNQLKIAPLLSIPVICKQLIRHAAYQLDQLIGHSQVPVRQDETASSFHTNKEYQQIQQLHSTQTGEEWMEKCNHQNRFILDEAMIIVMIALPANDKKNSLLKGYFTKNGHLFKFIKINYLPPCFYYFSLKNKFG
jgi:folate-dependent phosphoribosylglycinamide formyltransferase PurN